MHLVFFVFTSRPTFLLGRNVSVNFTFFSVFLLKFILLFGMKICNMSKLLVH
jgi:hypothetical protein